MTLENSVLSSGGQVILQGLLKELGVTDSKFYMTQSKQIKSNPSKQKTIAHGNLNQNDCFSKVARGNSASSVSRTIRGHSPVKGAVMSGKIRPYHQYLGKGFEIPLRESPGPIYPSISTLDTIHGQSFTKSDRMASEKASNNRGPDYIPRSSVGHQIESIHSNLKNVVFTKAKRFNITSEFISKEYSKGVTSQDSPPPTAYQTMSSTNTGKGVSISRARRGVSDTITKRNKEHREKEAAEGNNISSPLFATPIYNSKYANGPSFSIASKSLPSLADGDSVRSYRQQQVVSPGPGHYDPKHTVTEVSGPHVSFMKERLNNVKRETTPGPIYETDSAINKHVPAVFFGNASEGNARFVQNQYMGKNFVTALGSTSPGPKYNLPECPMGIAVTFASNERTPSRMRNGTYIKKA